MKYRCVKSSFYKTKQFQLVELFLETEGSSLEIEVNLPLTLQLSRGFMHPEGGFVIFIQGTLCKSFNEVFRTYDRMGLLRC